MPPIPTPIKAMRLKCLDCVCQSSNEVKLCLSVNCPLYPYRLGHRPCKSDGTETDVAPKPKKATPEGGWPFQRKKQP